MGTGTEGLATPQSTSFFTCPRRALLHISHLMSCRVEYQRANQSGPCSGVPACGEVPQVVATCCPYHLSLPYSPAQSWETWQICLECVIMLYSGCLPTALADNKGDAVSGL